MEFFVVQKTLNDPTQAMLIVNQEAGQLGAHGNRYKYSFDSRSKAEDKAKAMAAVNANYEYIVVEPQTGFVRDTPPIKRVDYK